MQVKKTQNSDTQATLHVIATAQESDAIKDMVLAKLSEGVKVPGFREGKAPSAVIQKHLDPARLQTAFLEEAINQLYMQAVGSEKLRPVDNPQIEVKKFVPFSALEFEAKITVLGPMKLADYKKLRMQPEKPSVTDKDVDEVIETLRTRMASKHDVERPAKEGDQVWIDFSGKDKNDKPVPGADGKDYPVLLGSDTFIPGFEDNLVGVKPGEKKAFTVKFPKDYRAKGLAGQPVAFTVTVKNVQEVIKPKADDAFAAQAGPVKTVKELRDDIKLQLKAEKERQAMLDFQSQIILELTRRSQFAVPDLLIDNQVEHLLRDLKQNLSQRGQTFEEYLAGLGQTEDEYKSKALRPHAEERVRASIVLAEIAELENLQVSPVEIDERLRSLSGQYNDPAMQAELNKPEARRDIASKLLTEKTINKLVEYTAANR